MNLKSIDEEAADCRAAWAAAPGATAGLHIHHETLVETVTEPIENRIRFILSGKPEYGRATRLRAMRPLTADVYADYEAKRDALNADYAAKCDALWADYEAKRVLLYADYKAKRESLYADYKAKRAPLYADYKAKRAPLYADYEAKRNVLWADYEAKWDPLNAELHAAHCTTDCPWDGRTLFPEVPR